MLRVCAVCPKNGHAIVSPRSDTTRVYCTIRTVIYTWSIDRSSIVRRRERERERGQVRQKGQDTIKPSLHARAPEPFWELARNYRPGTVLAC